MALRPRPFAAGTAAVSALLPALLAAGGDRLAAAERAYRAGDHAAALAGFTAELAAGRGDAGALLYNAGNCAFRLGDLARAVHYYRCALPRRPRDAALRFNLQLAQTRLGIDAPLAPPWWRRRWLTEAELWWLAIALQTAGLGGLLAAAPRHRAVRRLLTAIAVLGAAAAGRTLQLRFLPGPAEAVVLTADASLHAEPDAGAAANARLLPGDLVQIEAAAGGWVRVAGAHSRGWTAAANLGRIE